ncbi:hypothetical protein D9M70_538170 [compost metagenome]
MTEPDLFQRCLHALTCFHFADPAQFEAIGDIFHHGTMRPERVRLKHEADIAVFRSNSQAFAAIEHRLAADTDQALLRLFKASNAAQQSRFAAARCTKQRDNGTTFGRKRGPLQNMQATEIFVNVTYNEFSHGFLLPDEGRDQGLRR